MSSVSASAAPAASMPAAVAAPPRKRIEYLDIIRGVCILFVAYFHSGVSLIFAQYVSSICVHPFFFMAGYFHSTKRSVGDIFHKKVRTLILPYYVFGIFYFLVWLLMFHDSGRDVIHTLQAVLYMPTVDFPVEPGLYFLPMMFWGTMILTVTEKYIKNEPVKFVIMFLISWIGCAWTRHFAFRLPMSLDCAMAVYPYFYLGFRARKILAFCDGIIEKIRHRWMRVALYLVVTAVNYFLVRVNFLPNVPNILNGSWCIILLTHFNTCVIMLLWVYTFRFVENLKFLRHVNKALKFVGENSITFMLFGHVGLKIGRTVASMLPIPNLFVVKTVYYVVSIVVLIPVALLFSKTRLKYIFGK